VINDNFYPLTPGVAKKLRASSLTAAEWRIWSYLIEIEPWGDRYEDFNTLVLLDECDVSKATFYRAIAKFQELEIFDFQDNGFSIRNIHGVSSLKNEKPVAKMRQDSQKCENHLKNEKPVAKMRQDSQKCENQSLKPLQNEGFNSSQNIQIESDLKDTTEYEVSVPEIFEKYVEQLKLYGIYKQTWQEDTLILNPKLKQIYDVCSQVPTEKIEAGIRAFLAWIKTAKNVQDKYKALEIAILKGWEI
jgi:hypothetical protein